ncbi:unnamed protein product [Malus baccata var. baccata]
MSLAVEPTNQARSDGHKPQTHRMRTGGTATAGNRAFRDEHSRRIASSLRLRDLIQFPDPQEAKEPGNGFYRKSFQVAVKYFWNCTAIALGFTQAWFRSTGAKPSPLIGGKVTYFKCGVSLGVGLEHQVADGCSGLHFVYTYPPQPTFDPVEYQLDPPLKIPPPCTKDGDAESTTLSVLKAKSKEEGNTINYSMYEMLAGHVWRCASKVRNLPIDQVTKPHIVVDGRIKLQPPLHLLHVVVRMNNDYLRSVLDYLEFQLDLFGPCS